MKPIAGGQYRPLTEEGTRKIHDSALTLLSEIGVEVHSQLAFDTFQVRLNLGVRVCFSIGARPAALFGRAACLL